LALLQKMDDAMTPLERAEKIRKAAFEEAAKIVEAETRCTDENGKCLTLERCPEVIGNEIVFQIRRRAARGKGSSK
jgi:hypothetical protein